MQHAIGKPAGPDSDAEDSSLTRSGRHRPPPESPVAISTMTFCQFCAVATCLLVFLSVGVCLGFFLGRLTGDQAAAPPQESVQLPKDLSKFFSRPSDLPAQAQPQALPTRLPAQEAVHFPKAASPRPSQQASSSVSSILPPSCPHTRPAAWERWSKDADAKDASQRSPKKADGCSMVYLDVGSNMGVQVRKLYEPEAYRNAKILPMFDVAFGPAEFRRSKSSGLCAFGFEAGPWWKPRLKRVEEAYQPLGWRVEFTVPRAILDTEDEFVNFSTAGWDPMGDAYGAGATIVRKGIPKVNQNNTLQVRTLDLALWIRTNIINRDLGSGLGEPYVLMKMDIEGAEFRVLPKMLSKEYEGLLCSGVIDAILIEWHGGPREAKEITRQMYNRTRCGNRKPTILTFLDDETYGHDGVTFPNGMSGKKFVAQPIATP